MLFVNAMVEQPGGTLIDSFLSDGKDVLDATRRLADVVEDRWGKDARVVSLEVREVE